MAIGKNLPSNLNEIKNIEKNNKLLSVLGDHFYYKIFKRQHPTDCKNARILVCKVF